MRGDDLLEERGGLVLVGRVEDFREVVTLCSLGYPVIGERLEY